MQTYYIVKGAVTRMDAYEDLPKNTQPRLGDTEWQFSDGPAGKRGSSADYLSLEAGLRDLSPAIFIWDKAAND